MWTIRNMTRFYGEELLAPRPTPKLEDHPLSAVHDCLLNMFSGILHTGSNSSICNLRTRHAVVRGTHLLRLLMILKYVYYDLISDGSIPPSGSFSSSIFINNWRSRYSVSIPLGILYIGLWVPCTRRIYIYMHASVFSVVVLENVWLKYICKLKGFFLPSPIPPASKKNPLQIETTFTLVSICMSQALADGYATLNACCDCGKRLQGAEAAFWDYETRSRIFV